MTANVTGAILEVGPRFATIQEAIDAGDDGDVILIYPGFYYENLDPRGKTLWIRSKGGADQTFVRPKNPDQPTLVIQWGEGPALLFEGLTFERARRNAVQISSSAGTFINCDFRENEGEFGGAFASFGGAPILIGCQFYDNIAREKYPAGGALHIRGGSVVLENCDFRRNEASLQGGAIYGDGATLVAENCTFYDNNVVLDAQEKATGGGAVYWQNGEFTSKRSYWLKNQTSERGGAWYMINSSVNIQNSVFARNVSVRQNGGGIYTAASQLRCLNCVFAENETPTASGGGIYTNRTTGNIFNTIFWANRAQSGFHLFANGDSIAMDYSCGDGLTDGFQAQSAETLQLGKNMIFEDWQFTQDTLGLYQLTADSKIRNHGYPGSGWENSDGTRNTPGAYGGPFSGKMGAQPVIWDETALNRFRKTYGQELTVWGQTMILHYIQAVFGTSTTGQISQMGETSASLGYVDLATRQFQRVLKLDPGNVEALLGLAQIYEESGYPDLVEDAYHQALVAAPEHPRVTFHFGREAYQNEDWQTTIDFLRSTVKTDSLNAYAWQLLGRAALETGDFDLSQTALEEAIMSDSTQVMAYLWLAERADWLDQPEVAIYWLTGAKRHLTPEARAWLEDEGHLEVTRKQRAFKKLFSDLIP
ncbi:MAG: right-handed parallel beta-helix repeat-containing protein [Candidatus Marinimicrobia bacterium]|nr:right-handed parallel beta-helix repeat-containing protein [Candidatus Neomarinimicrobiota bacterium]MCF7902458.1 right-handed parallel beta-helix repeat-containing protein [Candidatus Neomarinimicrobiota bacterium]